jgi:CYTH domain-containing protein
MASTSGDIKMEIEKKFLLSGRPEILNIATKVSVKQGYLFVEDGELRIRQKDNKFFMTVKGDGTLSRSEWEVEIPQWVFENLWTKTAGKQVEKTRYEVEYQGLTLEIDEYYGNLAGLYTLECEFESEDAANAFILPEWASDAVDVTSNKAFKNKALAVNGRP